LVIVLEGDDMEEDVALFPTAQSKDFQDEETEQHIMAY
jgi:hypothetical protein